MFSSNINSYAKINFGLRILNKREDGYHNLETIFYPIRLHDEIHIDIQKSETDYNSVVLKSNKPFIPLSKDNLCYKAVEYFFKEFKIRECFKLSLYLNKHIPVGGGLGGGSSNAATVVKFLIKYLNIDIESNREKILNLALSIGSDVPFFLSLKPCYAAGRGEKMILLRDFKIDYDILIVNPNLHVSTKWAFEKLNFKKNFSKEPVLNKVRNVESDNLSVLVNDFEDIVFKK
ncbi:MAG: 4-(cytidine 5'-diphospho)-2-C-methyl-D-erythritol kinase [Ignavibacteria bacterium]|nr:4-(cytidine 5'-diphospho)-2-C-methyl-D-erythritol kinase [Ignavibacteria bacterium]